MQNPTSGQNMYEHIHTSWSRVRRFSYQNGFRTKYGFVLKTVFVQFCFWYENRFCTKTVFERKPFLYENRFCTKTILVQKLFWYENRRTRKINPHPKLKILLGHNSVLRKQPA